MCPAGECVDARPKPRRGEAPGAAFQERWWRASPTTFGASERSQSRTATEPNVARAGHRASSVDPLGP